MIVTEFYKTRNDGVNLVRTYSDKGYSIERDGVIYDEAIDPENSGREYTEVVTEESSELEQKAHAYDILTGVIE